MKICQTLRCHVATRRNPAATSAVTLQLINNRCGDEKLRTNLIKQLGGDVIQGLVGEPAVGSLGAVAFLVEVLTGKRLWSRMKEITSALMEEPAASYTLTGRIWCM